MSGNFRGVILKALHGSGNETRRCSLTGDSVTDSRGLCLTANTPSFASTLRRAPCLQGWSQDAIVGVGKLACRGCRSSSYPSVASSRRRASERTNQEATKAQSQRCEGCNHTGWLSTHLQCCRLSATGTRRRSHLDATRRFHLDSHFSKAICPTRKFLGQTIAVHYKHRSTSPKAGGARAI